MTVLVLLRHGESAGNAADVFTGWIDAASASTANSRQRKAGALLAARGFLPDVVHTSVERRAIATADLALAACGRSWVPVRRSWRLNSNHYGALQGRRKADVRAEAGEEQFTAWRRGFHVRPPQGEPDDDPRYAALPPDARPRGESLHDVTVRLLPYWCDAIIPDLCRPAACWWCRTATRCGRWSSTWTGSAMTLPPGWRCRTRFRCATASRLGRRSG